MTFSYENVLFRLAVWVREENLARITHDSRGKWETLGENINSLRRSIVPHFLNSPSVYILFGLGKWHCWIKQVQSTRRALSLLVQGCESKGKYKLEKNANT